MNKDWHYLDIGTDKKCYFCKSRPWGEIVVCNTGLPVCERCDCRIKAYATRCLTNICNLEAERIEGRR